MEDILSCVQINFHELHKFEEKVEDLFIFRAKKEDIHFIYVIDQRKRLILLRAFHNFKEYKKYLEKKKEIVKLVRRCEWNIKKYSLPYEEEADLIPKILGKASCFNR